MKTSLLGINGINGILVVSSGQAGISGAFRSLGLEKRPYVIYFDQTPCTEEALREDTADFVIDQDCFTQGYEAAQILARLLVKNQQPDSEYYYTNIYIKTRYNLQNCPWSGDRSLLSPCCDPGPLWPEHPHFPRVLREQCCGSY